MRKVTVVTNYKMPTSKFSKQREYLQQEINKLSTMKA